MSFRLDMNKWGIVRCQVPEVQPSNSKLSKHTKRCGKPTVSLLEAMDPWFLYIHGGFSIYVYVRLQEGSVLKKHCVPSLGFSYQQLQAGSILLDINKARAQGLFLHYYCTCIFLYNKN
jgi:hypothetical protein